MENSTPIPLMVIKRIALSQDWTLGVILSEGKIPFALTMERPWLNNQKSVSCIPKGEYTCKRVVKPKHGSCFEVTNVPNRTDILIHKGNFVWDSEGCIILGENYQDVMTSKSDKPVTSVQSSGVAYHEFMMLLDKKDEFKLVITEC